MRRAGVVVGIVAAGAVGAAAVAGGALALRAGHALLNPPPPPACTVTDGSDTYQLDPEQAQNASTIAAVAKRRGLSDHAVTIALATVLQESKLHNLDYGDRDSLGLFQQRPSQGWGTPAQVLDPVYAANKFYDALVQVAGWRSIPVAKAAQSVQQSGFPTAYAQWEPEARALAKATTGESPAAVTCTVGPAPAGDHARALVAAASRELGSPALGQPLTPTRGWTVAGWLVAHAGGFGIDRVSYAGRTWTADTGTWTPGPAAPAPPGPVTYHLAGASPAN